ncbi:hypothetical protein AOQ84DRAFT_376976 [Glonium stellatum]|uniref:Uncharacterized protein n=1 Tax=Glonium stellatum TaxID=574774 RepID=A0A8E2F0C2_9PEZI|nr:hypothetical protein AOQ84DRAFT_376976 [Glonium stellatum]
MANIKVPTVKLNNGVEMPQVGLGLWKVENDICADVVYNAIKLSFPINSSFGGQLPFVQSPLIFHNSTLSPPLSQPL